MTLDALLSDPALRLRSPVEPASTPEPTHRPQARVRIRDGSPLIAALAIPPGSAGTVLCVYGDGAIAVHFDGVGYVTGIAGSEVEVA